MFRVELQTSHGQVVTQAWIVPTAVLPKVVLWGERVFVLHYDPPEPGGVPVYREEWMTVAFPKNLADRDQTSPIP